MNINISTLSDVELDKLKKQINKEFERRDGARLKSDLPIMTSLYELFEDQLTDEGAGVIGVSSALGKLEKAILSICDYTYHNYRIRPFTKHQQGVRTRYKSVMQNGSKILVDDSDEYVEMSKEIIELIRKHKEVKDGSVDISG